LGPRRVFHSRDPGSFSRARQTRLYDHPDHRLSLGGKKAVRRVKKISDAHIFEAVVSRNVAQPRLIDELLGLFGGRTQPVMAHLIESGKLTLNDVQEAEKALRKLARKEKP
jgi:predicted transcriptional regulator